MPDKVRVTALRIIRFNMEESQLKFVGVERDPKKAWAMLIKAKESNTSMTLVAKLTELMTLQQGDSPSRTWAPASRDWSPTLDKQLARISSSSSLFSQQLPSSSRSTNDMNRSLSAYCRWTPTNSTLMTCLHEPQPSNFVSRTATPAQFNLSSLPLPASHARTRVATNISCAAPTVTGSPHYR